MATVNGYFWSWVDSGLRSGATYSYELVGIDACGGRSAPGGCRTATTTFAPPLSPTIQSYSASCQAVGLSLPGLDPALTFEIHRSDGASCSEPSVVFTTSNNWYSDTTVLAGRTYSYSTRAVDACGVGSAPGNCVVVSTPAAPARPVFTLRPGCNSIELFGSWSTGVSQYRFYRSTGATCKGATLLATSPSPYWNDTTVTNGLTYSYRVVAVDACGALSEPSACLTATAGPQGPLQPPGPLSISPTCTSTTLSWSGAGPGGFVVHRSAGDSCSDSMPAIGVSSGNSYLDPATTPGSTWTYRIEAAAWCGLAAALGPCSTVTVPTGPSAALAPAATEACNAIDLSWLPVTNAAGYEVWRSDGGGCTSPSFVDTVFGTTFRDAGLPAGTTYSYDIRSFDSCGGVSPAGACRTAETVSHVVSPTPGAWAACNVVSLGWTPPSGAASTEIRRSDGSGCAGASPIGTATYPGFSDSSVSPGSTYSYELVAIDLCGNRATPGGCRTVTTPLVPGTPAPPYLTASCDAISVSGYWVQGAASFEIYRSDDEACSAPQLVATVGSGVTFVDPVPDGASRSYQERAIDACGGVSPLGGCAALRVGIPDPPPAPTVTAVCQTAHVSAPALPGLSYELWRGSGAGCESPRLLTSYWYVDYWDYNLPFGTTVGYFLVARNSCGVSAPGACTAVTTPPDPGSVGPTPTLAPHCGVVDLSWHPTSGTTSYTLSRWDGSGCSGSPSMTESSLANPFWSDSSVIPGGTYSYRVASVNCSGSWSGGCVSASVPASPLVPPTGLAVEAGCGAATVTWDPSPAATSYDVVRYAGGVCTAARFESPTGLAVNAAGALLVSDDGNPAVRRISGGVSSTIAGAAGQWGNQDGPGPTARFSYVYGLTFDDQGTLWVSDGGNGTIRKIAPDGEVTTVAGGGSDGWGDGQGSAASFDLPLGIAFAPDGFLYVADYYNHVIRRVSRDGMVTTIAGLPREAGSADGTGTEARFRYPVGVAVDPDGNLLVADSENFTIRKVTPAGVVTTVAGTPGQWGADDGEAHQARFDYPYGVAVDAAGNILVVDYGNQTVRRISTDGIVSTLDPAHSFFGPFGLVARASGEIVVTDWDASAIRRLTPDGAVSTLLGRPGIPGTADGALDLFAGSTTSTSFVDSTLPEGIYAWQVVSRFEGCSAPSTGCVAATVSGTPGEVGNSLRLQVAKEALAFHWSNLAGATSYTVFEDEQADGPFSTITATAPSGDTGASASLAGPDRFYRVVPVGNCAGPP